jgi:hypothetical protein
MSYRVCLKPEKYLDDLDVEYYHSWWKNFAISELYPIDADCIIEINRLREETFRKYHFKMADGHYIEFDSEEHFTWFVLRFS